MSCVVWFLTSMAVALFLPFPHSATGDPDTESRINQVCSKSYDYNLCEDIYDSQLVTNSSGFKGLTQVAISQTLLYSSDTLVFLRRSQTNETNKTQKDLYQVCIEGYGILSNQFQDAFLKFGDGDYRSMLFDIGDCERFVNDCESVLGSKVAVHNKNHVAKVLVKMSNVSGELIGTD